MSNSFVPGLSKPKFMGRLRYGVAGLNFQAVTGAVGTYVFSANGLFDPNITGGSLQPAGHSQLMTSYEHYTVNRAKATVLFTNNANTSAIVALCLEADNVGSTDPNNMLELPYEQVVNLEPTGVYGSTKSLSLEVDLNKYFGENVNKTSFVYRGDAASNPTEQAYFHCKAYGAKLGTADVYLNVKIEYTAWYTEPRELTPSLAAAFQRLVLDEVKATKEEQDGILVTQLPVYTDANVLTKTSVLKRQPQR